VREAEAMDQDGSMTWTLTEDLGEFLASAEPFLADDPVAETVLLTLTRSLRERGVHDFGQDKPLMGWWADPSAQPAAILLQMPGRPLHLSCAPSAPAEGLADVLARHTDRISEVRVSVEQEDAVSAGVFRRTGKPPIPLIRTRLYRLGQLVRPSALPDGAAHLATAADQDLATGWFGSFLAAVGESETPEQVAAQIRERIVRREIYLWRRPDGVATAMAALSVPIERMSRISLVYTPKEHRRRGYAGAITAALSRLALDAGTERILLVTDLANLTSNALYQRIGYQPVSDSVILTL
jgi:predicted GNAT family acetyltransferase